MCVPPPGRRRAHAVLDLERVAEIEEVRAGPTVSRQLLP